MHNIKRYIALGSTIILARALGLLLTSKKVPEEEIPKFAENQKIEHKVLSSSESHAIPSPHSYPYTNNAGIIVNRPIGEFSCFYGTDTNKFPYAPSRIITNNEYLEAILKVEESFLQIQEDRQLIQVQNPQGLEQKIETPPTPLKLTDAEKTLFETKSRFSAYANRIPLLKREDFQNSTGNNENELFYDNTIQIKSDSGNTTLTGTGRYVLRQYPPTSEVTPSYVEFGSLSSNPSEDFRIINNGPGSRLIFISSEFRLEYDKRRERENILIERLYKTDSESKESLIHEREVPLNEIAPFLKPLAPLYRDF